jgi:hypothetical protein
MTTGQFAPQTASRPGFISDVNFYSKEETNDNKMCGKMGVKS